MIQKLGSSQAHCVRSHQGRLAEIIRSLFSDTEDENTKTVKKLVFDVDDGKAILASDHPVMIGLAELSKGVFAHRLACLCLAFDAVSSFQSPSRSSSRRDFRGCNLKFRASWRDHLPRQANHNHQKAFTDLLGAHSRICSESYTDFIA